MVRKRIILLITLLAPLIVIVILTKPWRQRARVPALPKILSLTEEKKIPSPPEEVFVPPKIGRIEEPISWGRDPFLSPLTQEIPEGETAKAGALTLTGIVRDGKGAQAVIGDYIVSVGNVINGKRVISIKKNKVILMKGKDKEILSLEEE